MAAPLPAPVRVRNGKREVTVQDILEAIMAVEGSAQPERELAGLAGLPVPETYRGVVVRAGDTRMFDGMATRDKDPRKALHLQEVPTPELGPGEALVAVMASAINYNTVWTSIFEPLPTFKFLQRYGRTTWWGRTRPAWCCGPGPG
jgi:crotonyl-CoA reductase